ncbi:hypothetical protein [Actinomadura macra]|uniref:hypothetical protein n=1 Tax=Actinomadura macra TaxID=46164 RepID=UPI000836CC6A|nr:hypothetical protein [Actinomadura macra]
MRRFFAAEHHAQLNEIAAFAFLASRFPHSPAAGFFMELAGVVDGARSRLLPAAASVGLVLGEPADTPIPASAHAFGGYVCWLAMRSGQAGAALALHTDLVLWCESCARISSALQRRDGTSEEATAYFAAYAEPPEALLESALDVADDGIRRGERSEHAMAAARPVAGYLRLFWDAVAEAAR